MLATNHLGTEREPKVHPVVAATAREAAEQIRKRAFRRFVDGRVASWGSTEIPIVSRNTEHCDWRIADLVSADKPVTLYLVVPPSRHQPHQALIRLILNQIGRRLTETLEHQGR